MSCHAPLSVLADQAAQILQAIRDLEDRMPFHFMHHTMADSEYYRTLESLGFATLAMVFVETRLCRAAAAAADAKASAIADAAIAADGRA